MKGSKVLHIVLTLFAVALLTATISALECSCDAFKDEVDPALKEMTYDIGNGPETFMAYVEPDVTSFYKDTPVPASTKVVPKFNGLAGKFINLSINDLRLYWEPYKGGQESIMRYFKPFDSGGTATFPGHRFFFTLDNDSVDSKKDRLQEYVIGDYPENIYVYNPYLVEGDPQQTERNLQVMNPQQRAKYDLWMKTLDFNKQYLQFTGRTYLTNYLRNQPTHFMWRADYFGQEHWVTTKETHFTSLPPNDSDELRTIVTYGRKRVLKDDDPRLLQQYRDPTSETMNMTLKVLSCAPRVFEIENFLSPVEVQHIMELATTENLSESTTGDGGKKISPEEQRRRKTRTSKNSWVPRERTPVVDAVYRRSADLLQIDEAFFRYRDADEYPSQELSTRKSVAESLQLVHYDETQEYTAHHDFGYTPIDDSHHGARFSTLLFYLNDEGLVGGETNFPRWVNAETFQDLRVKPKVGKAVLFYSQLPDGNMDDFSQHAALPVIDGEKWLINLWVWDPRYEK